MKKLIPFIILASTLLLWTSCGSDDCAQEDWIGTYTGVGTCDGSEEESDETFVITAGASENQILIDGDPLTIDGCTAQQSITDPIFGSEIESTLTLDGNTLTIDTQVNLGGVVQNCSYTGNK